MTTFIIDRTEDDVNIAKDLIAKVDSTPWASLTTAEQKTYLNEEEAYEDKGRFGLASASRISTYLIELTSRFPLSTPWGAKNFKGAFDYSVGSPTYFPVNREDFKEWQAALQVFYGGPVIAWDFDSKPYLNYELLNELESKSELIYNNRVSVSAEQCGAIYCGEGFGFFNAYSATL